MVTTYKIFTDGASRGNPGPSASAFLIINNENKILFQDAFYVGITTNNNAEYIALLKAIEKLIEMDTLQANLLFFSDSKLMVNQINGQYKINKDHIKEYVSKINEYKSKFLSSKFEYIPREQNRQADKLCNQVLDKIT